MRILCINFKSPQDPSLAEVFLSFSPRVQFRYPHYLFMEVSGTAHFFGGEEGCLHKALEVAHTFSPQAVGAIATTAAYAQMLATWKPFAIATSEEHLSLKSLGLDALKELEGLHRWENPKQIEHMISFFHTLGIHTLEAIWSFQISSLRERWGSQGVLLWNRLHSQDIQLISPFIPRDPLEAYGYFDNPVSDLKILMFEMQKHLNFLFLRLHGLARFAHKVDVVLHCEYSSAQHHLSIEPVSPSRDLKLFTDLLEKKLQKIELTNPLKEIEIIIFDSPEKIQQLDFFEPRDHAQERWRRLISFAQQENCRMGFLQYKAHHFPEQSYELSTDLPQNLLTVDVVHKHEEAIQVKAAYAKGLQQSPRPTLLLKKPQLLSPQELRNLQFLSKLPTERIESHWWQISVQDLKHRDYYFALSQQEQLLWVFQDRLNSQVYLHGYFD